MCNLDCCHGYKAHMESVSVVPENWYELLPAFFPNVVIRRYSQRSCELRLWAGKLAFLMSVYVHWRFPLLRGNNQTPGRFFCLDIWQSQHPQLIWSDVTNCPAQTAAAVRVVGVHRDCPLLSPRRETLASIQPTVTITARPSLTMVEPCGSSVDCLGRVEFHLGCCGAFKWQSGNH